MRPRQKGVSFVNDWLDNLRAHLAEQLKVWEVPSAGICVVKDGKVLLCDGVGLKDNESQPATGDTLYQIASCSKAFTATAAAMLATEGKLDFDTPIIEYMPSFRLNDDYATNHLTVRDFLSHRSGLPRHEYAWYGTGFSRAQLMKNLRDLPLSAPIRYRFQYSNFNYLIVGCLIEEISGMPFEEFLTERIFKPLHMDRTVAYSALMRKSDDYALPFNRAKDYVMGGVRRIPFYCSPAEDPDSLVGDPTAAAGCVCTCASDMAKWLQFNLDKGRVDGKQLVREDLMQLLVTAHIDTGDGGAYKPQRSMTSYGLGWSLYNYRGHRMAEHGGNINGFTSSTAFVPDLNLGVFISVNMDVALIADAFVQETVDAVMGATDGNWYQRMLDNNKAMFDRVKKFYAAFGGTPVPNTQPSHPIGDYAGVYEAPGYRRFLITEKDGKLTADFNHFVVGLKHFHYDSFATEDTIGELPAGFVITFGANPKGEISTLSATLGSEQGLKPIIFTKAK